MSARRGGRPKLPESQRRVSGVFLRLSAAERARLESSAQAAGLSLAAFVRAAALRLRVEPARPRLELALLGEIQRLGNNLNQALILTYTHRAPHELLPAVERLLEAMAEVRRCLNARPEREGPE